MLIAALAFPVFAQEKVDLDIIHKIKQEAFDNSKVMETLSGITDLNGPRLTGSPEFRQAAEWAKSRLESYGIANVRFERWGPFGRSWSVRSHSVELVEPRYARLNAIPLAWTEPTAGPVTAEAVYASIETVESFSPRKIREANAKFQAEWRGKLKGKIVLLTRFKPAGEPAETKPLLRRYTDQELSDIANAPTPAVKIPIDPSNLEPPDDPEKARQFFNSIPFWLLMKMFDQYMDAMTEKNAFLKSEGVAAVLTTDGRSHTGLVFAEEAGAFRAKDTLAPPTFRVTKENYGRIVRLLEKNSPVKVRVELKADLSRGDVDAFNIIGEMPGGAKADETVMIGAHFDSWHAGTGTTDNATGSAVMIEVMRILKTLGLKMDRTVRIGLWSGEEQGLLGSLAYVREHFGDPATMKLTGQHAKLSGYFNLDNGSGKIRGVYLQGNDAMRPIFAQWLSPWGDLGARTITIKDTSGTDHQSFDAVGLPGFQFIQDPLDYGTVTHHSDMDVYEHAIEADLMQASAIIASMVYEAANRPDMLPRKTLPKPVQVK